jgi:SagB-type dehydrogenase family enzyme
MPDELKLASSAPGIGTSAMPSRAEVVLDYHERTKHRLDRYARGPETLDWTAQPDPFREYRGARRLSLPLPAERLPATLADLYVPGAVRAQPFSLDSLGALLQLSMAISAWKEYGPDRWALRCNPSSGNLHPTETYVIARRVTGLHDGLYHYASRDHALEQRCAHAPLADTDPAARLWIGLASVHWREAWKYGERAFRYCQHDVGHALGALRYAAGVLGWTLRLADAGNAGMLAELLGLDRDADYAGVEREEPDLLVEVLPANAACQAPPLPKFESHHWTGHANLLDPHPMYDWPVIAAATAASRQQTIAPAEEYRTNYPPLARSSAEPAARVILNRRSAQRFDARYTMSSAELYRMLDCLLPRAIAPWDLWPHVPRLHPILFVHRIEGLEAGLYALPRRPEAETELRTALRAEFAWQRETSAPAHLPLYRLLTADCRAAARTLSCHQAIAADGCFSLGMLAEFEGPVRSDPWCYRELHREAGLLGQVLYLEAEAAGLRGTGIGCYFDDAVHEVLGLRDTRFQSLYHFTIGRPLTDARITTQPPYPARATQPTEDSA